MEERTLDFKCLTGESAKLVVINDGTHDHLHFLCNGKHLGYMQFTTCNVLFAKDAIDTVDSTTHGYVDNHIWEKYIISEAKRHIAISVDPKGKLNPKTLTYDFFDIKTITQTHLNEDFSNNSNQFLASNGVNIVSCACPEWYTTPKTLFVRGTAVSHDNDIVNVSREDALEIVEAVEEYNKKEGVNNNG